MKPEMHDYDLFPKVVIENDPVGITVKPLGRHAAFRENTRVVLQPRNDRDYPTVTEKRPKRAHEMILSPEEDGCLRFTYTFWGEQPWFVLIYDEGQERPRVRLSMFSLHEDMRGRYPYMGDLHVHSCESDGHEAPAVVAANFRKAGYDFTVLSDHGRYCGSLEAIRAYEGVPHDLNIVPGEECHLPGNCVHIVNFGGLWSVHGQTDAATVVQAHGDDPFYLAADGKTCKPVMTEDSFRALIAQRAKELTDLPEGVDAYTCAACLWAFEKIREADGLAIFAHPFWIVDNALNVSEALTDYLLSRHAFDAFELLGGERYLDQNEFQVYKYEQMRAKGIDFPVVGSSDSHGSTENNPKAHVGATIVFARKNERRELIDSVKAQYDVCVDHISPEYRLAGDFRFVQFGRFLMDYYFPLHDELCFEEGRLMKAYATGSEENAEQLLSLLSGRCDKLLCKYFAY